MRPISASQLERMGNAQEAAMLDTCVVMRYSETFDAMHHPVPAWTDGPILPCGLDMTGGDEIGGDGRVLVTWSASLRLPLDTVLDLRDRIHVVMRFGQACGDMVFDIAAPVQVGPSGLVVRLRSTDPKL